MTLVSHLDLLLRPFNFRTMAPLEGATIPTSPSSSTPYSAECPAIAICLVRHRRRPSKKLEDLLLRTVCNPSHALFNESAYLFREDPGITDRALYHSLLIVTPIW